jgi:hypothetical protein
LRLRKIGIDEADSAQHRTTRRLLDAVDDQTGEFTRIDGGGFLFGHDSQFLWDDLARGKHKRADSDRAMPPAIVQ